MEPKKINKKAAKKNIYSTKSKAQKIIIPFNCLIALLFFAEL